MPAKAGDGLYVALLRGVNVGGKNKLPMNDLAEMFAAAGCSDVRTFIQSGNVVFRSGARAAVKIPERIEASIFETYGFRSVVVSRSAHEFGVAVAANPFLHTASDTKELHVMFLAHAPAASAVASLDPNRSKPDTFVVNGREIYLHLKTGAADTKLTNAYFDAKLGTTSTGRNWNTVLKLAELLGVDKAAKTEA